MCRYRNLTIVHPLEKICVHFLQGHLLHESMPTLSLVPRPHPGYQAPPWVPGPTLGTRPHPGYLGTRPHPGYQAPPWVPGPTLGTRPHPGYQASPWVLGPTLGTRLAHPVISNRKHWNNPGRSNVKEGGLTNGRCLFVDSISLNVVCHCT